MNHNNGSTTIYKGRGESWKGVALSMNHHRGFTPIYKGRGDPLKGLDHSINHRRGLLLFTTSAVDQ